MLQITDKRRNNRGRRSRSLDFEGTVVVDVTDWDSRQTGESFGHVDVHAHSHGFGVDPELRVRDFDEFVTINVEHDVTVFVTRKQALALAAEILRQFG